MTCIVGLVENGTTYMGGDSAGVSGFDITIRQDEKVFKNGPMLFGFTSSFRMGQLIRYVLDIPKHTGKKDNYRYMCTDFIDALIKCFKDKEYACTKEGVVSGGDFLVAYKNSLYHVYRDFQVGCSVLPYNACGCGESYALGALSILHDHFPKMDPKDKVIEALKSAETFSAGVSGPFHVLTM